MDQGWIKLHRQFIKWEWYQKSEMVHLFLHLLVSANHEEKSWQGNIVKRGQLITGLKVLQQDTGISAQTLRTCLERLKSTGEITTKSTNKFRLITLLNYDKYQNDERKLTSKSTVKLTNNQQTTNKQLTSNNNGKNEKNDNNTSNKKIWKDGDTIQLKDCTALRRFGVWVDRDNHSVIINRAYYPEIP